MPSSHTLKALWVHSEQMPDVPHKVEPETPPEAVTEHVTADASRNGRYRCRKGGEFMFEDEVPGKGEQSFVWNREPYHAEPQHSKEGRISVLGNPGEDGIDGMSSRLPWACGAARPQSILLIPDNHWNGKALLTRIMDVVRAAQARIDHTASLVWMFLLNHSRNRLPLCIDHHREIVVPL